MFDPDAHARVLLIYPPPWGIAALVILLAAAVGLLYGMRQPRLDPPFDCPAIEYAALYAAITTLVLSPVWLSWTIIWLLAG